MSRGAPRLRAGRALGPLARCPLHPPYWCGRDRRSPCACEEEEGVHAPPPPAELARLRKQNTAAKRLQVYYAEAKAKLEGHTSELDQELAKWCGDSSRGLLAAIAAAEGKLENKEEWVTATVQLQGVCAGFENSPNGRAVKHRLKSIVIVAKRKQLDM